MSDAIFLKILSRIEFYYEMRDVLRDEKPPSSSLVSIKDVLDFIFDVGLEEATLFAFDEDEVFTFDDDDYDGDDDDSSDDDEEDTVSSLEVSDIE